MLSIVSRRGFSGDRLAAPVKQQYALVAEQQVQKRGFGAHSLALPQHVGVSVVAVRLERWIAAALSTRRAVNPAHIEVAPYRRPAGEVQLHGSTHLTHCPPHFWQCTSSTGWPSISMATQSTSFSPLTSSS